MMGRDGNELKWVSENKRKDGKRWEMNERTGRAGLGKK